MQEQPVNGNEIEKKQTNKCLFIVRVKILKLGLVDRLVVLKTEEVF